MLNTTFINATTVEARDKVIAAVTFLAKNQDKELTEIDSSTPNDAIECLLDSIFVGTFHPDHLSASYVNAKKHNAAARRNFVNLDPFVMLPPMLF
jgi:hypothetical protein